MKNKSYKKKKERKFEVNNDIKIIKYNINLLPHILNFIKKSVFTNRTKNTWIKNDMTSVNIRKGNKLLAVLPFEKIYLKIKNKFEKVLWISAVSVLPKYRDHKLGSKMLQYSEKIFKKKFKYIFVMREKEKNSLRAFNWYKKNGFKKVSKILSYEKKIISSNKTKPNFELLERFNSFKKKGPLLNKIFYDNNKSFNGYKKRNPQFWFNLKNHYYNHFYKFKIIIIRSPKNKFHYALLGKTKMRDDCFRLEILEFCSNDTIFKKLLLDSISYLAIKEKCKKIRIKFSNSDKIQSFLKKNMFKKIWETNVLVKKLTKNQDSFKKFKFFQTEYI